MIYNDTLKASYGNFNDVAYAYEFPRYKPAPTDSDYKTGFITRYFAKKINENKIIEVAAISTTRKKNPLYKLVELQWKISGPKDDIYVSGILNRAGVIPQNKSEIERVMKEDGVDLSHVLRNHLEYWKGS